MPKCETCGKEFATADALAQHGRDKHGSESAAQQRPEIGAKPPQEKKPKRRSLRRRNRHPVAIGLIVAAVALGAGLYYVVALSVIPPDNYPFQCLGTEPLQYHVHSYLRIVISGQNVTIPLAIGIHNPVISNGYASGGPSTCFEPVHTHDSSGIIHLESSTSTNYTLGDFFTIWKDTYHSVTIGGFSHPVILNSTDVLGFKADSSHRIVVLVDGRPYQGNILAISLTALDYCTSADRGRPPCSPTAPGDPAWQSGPYPYGTHHTIVVEYVTATG